MTIVDWFKILWPVGVVLVGVAIRIEVAQALNKQRLNAVESDLKAEKEDRKAADTSLHARVSRNETDLGNALAEIRRDIKTLLSRP